MATYRNRSSQTQYVQWNQRNQSVEPDATIDVADELVENVDLNDNFVRVDSPTAPPVPVDTHVPEAPTS